MTLIELLFLLFPIMGASIGVGIGVSGGETSLPGVVLYGTVGGVAGLAAYVLLGLLIAGLIRFGEWWRPGLPMCRQGRCGTDDYVHLWMVQDLPETDRQLAARVLQEGLGSLMRCRCGDRYVQSLKGRRVLEVGPDGTLRQYRYHRSFGRKWLPDTRG
ncbi:hypothetical protein JRI60_22105 [Archangium violaceum]|uniref:hypothetical protein n=1 Tax=Archangium violaceum TaxID=83451 RepID=UPI0019524051|nr:hypothetical protein [Archangium violaceum]QRO01518.1 hypothetical protein JRI60_22105 [Archangium violaceum]